MSKKLETIDIKGKQYITVNERLKYFRENFKDFKLTTKVLKIDNGIAILKAEVRNKEGDVVADGLACEKEGSSFINKTSHIENCQTSAWGRALGNFGIGIDSSVCSADEVANAIIQQNKAPLKKVADELKQEAYQQVLDKKFQSLKSDLESCKTLEDLKLCAGADKFKKDSGELDKNRLELLKGSYKAMEEELSE